MVHGEDTVLGDAAGNSELFVTAETHVGRAPHILQDLSLFFCSTHSHKLLGHCSIHGPSFSCERLMTDLVRPAANPMPAPPPAPAARDGEGSP